MLRIDVGCGDCKPDGYVGLDIQDLPGVDKVIDFAKDGLPYPDSSVDEIRAFDFVEHIQDKVYTLKEFWRVCKPGGIVNIQVPDASVGQGGFRDPTHVSFWCPQSFMDMYMKKGRYHPGGYNFDVKKFRVTPLQGECRWICVELAAIKA